MVVSSVDLTEFRWHSKAPNGLSRRDPSPTREAMIVEELNKLRARDEARRRLRAEQLGARDARPVPVTLAALLAEPDEPVSYRISELMPAGSRIILAAQFKAGKTTLRDNLVRSLVDGEDFLGRFPVIRAARRVGVIDTEMSRVMLRRWLREQRITRTDAVVLIPLRGSVSSLDLLDPQTRRSWADQLRQFDLDVLILDCLRPVLDALGLDENTDAGRFLVAFDELLALARITDAVLVHHMGHLGERSRGSSRLRDWPDVEWRLVREKDSDDPAAPRYISAYGRDVDLPESALTYDPHTRHLAITGGNRQDATARKLIPRVLDLLDEQPDPLSGREIEKALTDAGLPRAAVRDAIKLAVADGQVTTSEGPRRATLHRLSQFSAPVRRSAPTVRQRTVSECASAPIDGALIAHPVGQSVEPARHGGLTDGGPTCIRCSRPAPNRNPNTWLCARCADQPEDDRDTVPERSNKPAEGSTQESNTHTPRDQEFHEGSEGRATHTDQLELETQPSAEPDDDTSEPVPTPEHTEPCASWSCQRPAVEQVGERWFCRTHANDQRDAAEQMGRRP